MTRNRSIYCTILMSALVACTGITDQAAATSPAYTVTDLGTLGGTYIGGYGINASGQVTGFSNTTGDAATHAFLWTPTTPNGASGTMLDLGTLGQGFGINDSGQVTGGASHAFLWTPTTPNGVSGTMIDLGTLGGTYSEGRGINASGQVTGRSNTTEGAGHAFLYDGTMNDLGTLGGTDSYGFGINDSGQVTGSSDTTENVIHAFLYDGTMHDLGTLGGTFSRGFGINASGQVAGLSSTPGDATYHAFLYDGTLHDLGTLGGIDSVGTGINDSGQVTGHSYTTEVAIHAFLYTSGSGMIDLNTLIDPLSGWELEQAVDINDAGQITGFGQIGGQRHAFLLTSVPEPASLALAVLGVAALAIRRGRRIAGLLTLLCALSFTAAAQAAVEYTVTDLGTLGGLDSYGYGINASGQVTGNSYNTPGGGGPQHAFLWKPTTPNGNSGTMNDLGTLGGSSSFGQDINASGQVTGWASTTGHPVHAFLWTPTTPNGASGTMYDLGTLGGTYSYGWGINASGQVTGRSYTTGDAENHAFVYDGTLHDLGTLGGTYSEGLGINDSGQVAGFSYTTGDAAGHAFLYDGALHDLGTLGGTNSVGFGINASGQVAGVSGTTGGAVHAFLYDGTLNDLGTLDGTYSVGYGINASGQVTGYAGTSGDAAEHAFLYTSGTGMVDLNTLIDPLSGWVLEQAIGINDAGQITGFGLFGGRHAFLLTPVPEPASLALAVLGVAALAVRRSRRIAGLLCLLCALSFTAVAQAAVEYTVTDLGTLGGTHSVGLGINASGQVTGSSNPTGSADYHTFLWTPTTPNGVSGTMLDLGTLGGTGSGGTVINASGQVTGISYTTGDVEQHAILWTPTTPNGDSGTLNDLGTLGGTYSYGSAINASGQVAGVSNMTGDVNQRAFLWTPTTPNGDSGTLNDLGTLGGNYSGGLGINGSGQVTGHSSTTGDAASHAFLYDGTMNDLGTLGGNYSTGYAINASGQVTGSSSLAGDADYHAFLYDGTMHDLGTLGGFYSVGSGINSSGQVAGYSLIAENSTIHAFLYTSGRGMVDLNTLIDPLSGWELFNAQGINDAGQISGFGWIGGRQHAFLLTPVPEPATIALLALGLPLLGRRNLRRSRASSACFCAFPVPAA